MPRRDKPFHCLKDRPFCQRFRTAFNCALNSITDFHGVFAARYLQLITGPTRFSMNTVEAELVYDAKALLGEGPAWHDSSGKLYWVDIEKGCALRYDPNTGDGETFPVGDKIGALAPCRSGGLILGLRKGIARFTPEEGEIHPIVEVEADLPANRFNDGKCDPSGRFWIGSMGQNRTGALYRVNSSMKVEKILSGITISNGLAWNTDKKKFYYIDSPTNRVDVFDYCDSTGEIANRRTCITVAEADGMPDGMSIDREGMLWIAHWGGWGITRYNPDTGEKLMRVKVPASNTTSCVFGGENLDILYITSARVGLSEKELHDQPLAGGLFKYDTQTQGWPTDEFAD